MTFDEYQAKALTTDAFYKKGMQLDIMEPAYVAKILGLVGESGEVAEKFKKLIRNNNGEVTEADRKDLLKELGDVLWYIAVLAEYLGSDFESVAQANLDKLADRDARGVIKSEGDNR